MSKLSSTREVPPIYNVIADTDKELTGKLSNYGKFYFRPLPGEQVQTDFTPAQETRAAICGRVLDPAAPVEEVARLVRLMGGHRVEEGDLNGSVLSDADLALISRFVTDGDGHFIFGPLEGGTLYLIKVFRDDVKLRELEIRTE